MPRSYSTYTTTARSLPALLNYPLARTSVEYCRAVLMVALNDEPGETDRTVVADSFAAQVVAEAFNVEPTRVALDILHTRAVLLSA